jgi:hypothetical protein
VHSALRAASGWAVAEPNTSALALLEFSAPPNHPDGLILTKGWLFNPWFELGEPPLGFLELLICSLSLWGFVYVVQPTPPRSQPHAFQIIFRSPSTAYVSAPSILAPFAVKPFRPVIVLSQVVRDPCLLQRPASVTPPQTGCISHHG